MDKYDNFGGPAPGQGVDPYRSRAVLPPRQPQKGFRELRLRRPHPALEPFIASHYLCAWDEPGGQEDSMNVLFAPTVNLATTLSGVTVRGVRRTTRHAPKEGRLGVLLGTSFRPGAFRLFSERSTAAVNDTYSPLTAMLGPSGEAIAAELFDLVEDEDAYYDAIESILIDCHPDVDSGYELVSQAEAAIRASGPGASVEEIADQTSVSVRTLQRAFVEYVGVGPKWVLRRYRVQEASERIASGDHEGLLSLAHDLGYFDQAHLARDFRVETGFSPRAYERAIRSLSGASGDGE